MTGRWASAGVLLLGILLGLSCRKAPLFDVGAGFTLADATWFAEEQTLFLFWEVHAEQGIGDPSVIEVAWDTDVERRPWTPVSDLPAVHPHVPVDCGPHSLCGSTSVHVPIQPRDVRIRLRYHRDGELALDPSTTYTVVGNGPAHTHRSLVVYGVFNHDNQRIQWRARHQFPTVRNHRAEALGLRRAFAVHDATFGTRPSPGPTNPYGYGVACPTGFQPSGMAPVQTLERAIFAEDLVPVEASEASVVCAQATVTDALGTFTTGAIARKNPEVRPAFPVLRSPVQPATPLKFFLAPCNREISPEHEAMQRQRLQLQGVPTTCIEDWRRPGFVDGLISLFRQAMEAERVAGHDMVLVIGLHQDEPGVSERVEEALMHVLPEERHRNSPRLAGAFVLDSTIRGLSEPDLKPLTLWCPSTLPRPNELPDASMRSCAVIPDNPDLELGPFTFGMLPILPSRSQYLNFIDTYSKRQAGKVLELEYLAPEFPATSEHVDFGEFGVITFLNRERISAAPGDAFSWCAEGEPELVVFRSEMLADPAVCEALELPPEACGVLTLDFLPAWHEAFQESSYELGVFWEFPFLLRMDYELFQAGAVHALSFSVPFGLSSLEESWYGSVIWTQDRFVLADNLLQCERFCDHPTFDSAGVYQVRAPFRTAYANACYRPRYPRPGDSGFPRDP